MQAFTKITAVYPSCKERPGFYPARGDNNNRIWLPTAGCEIRINIGYRFALRKDDLLDLFEFLSDQQTATHGVWWYWRMGIAKSKPFSAKLVSAPSNIPVAGPGQPYSVNTELARK